MNDAITFAREWIRERKNGVSRLMEQGYDLRADVLRHLAVDDENGCAKAGLPGIYIAVRADRDPLCFDLVYELQPELIEALSEPITTGRMQRPSRKRGAPYRTGGRDFVLLVLAAALQDKFPLLCLTANDESGGQMSVTEVMYRALDLENFKVLDNRKPIVSLSVPAHRSLAKALGRFRQGTQVPELFWD